jgi:hypothetical protein
MENAKKVYILSNREIVSIGDLVRVETTEEIQVIKVNDINETYIAGIITLNGEEIGTNFDAYFSELRDAKVIK